MTPLNDFDLNSNLLTMVHDYNRASDLVKLGTKGRLRAAAIKKLELEVEKLSAFGTKKTLQTLVELLAEDFRNLIEGHFGLKMNTLSVFRRGVDEIEPMESVDEEGNEVFLEFEDSLFTEDLIAEIKLESGESVELNLTKLSLNQGEIPQTELIKEKPILCWILDSRSPFYSQDFSTQILEISVLSNFRNLMLKEYKTELVEVLRHVFFENVH